MFRSIAFVATVLLVGSTAGLASAQDSAYVQGKDADTLVHYKNPQPYRVCHVQGNEQLAVSYDGQKAMLDPGDCIHLEASKIGVQGQSDKASHRVRFGSVAGPRGQKWFTQTDPNLTR